MKRITGLKLAGVSMAAIGTLLVGPLGSTAAQAQVIDESGTASFYVDYGNMEALIFKNTSTQAYATVTIAGSYGVQSRAHCQRANGGTQWYESTIRATSKGSSSHYDCDNNGTYNRAVVDIGGDFS